MPLGRRGSRIQVLVDGMEVELRTPDGELLTSVRDATINLSAGEVPTIDLTFYMPSVNADIKVGTCWMMCPICGDHVNHNCDEEDGENVTVYRPNPPVGRTSVSVAVSGGVGGGSTGSGVSGTGGVGSSGPTPGAWISGAAGPGSANPAPTNTVPGTGTSAGTGGAP